MRSALTWRAESRSLGRTTVGGIDSAVFDSDGLLVRTGSNQIGRYSLHLHHLYGVKGAAGPQFTVESSSFRDTRKWAVAVHDSHYGRIADSVIYHAEGAGIATEDGSETGNVIERALVIRSDGSGFGVESRGRKPPQLGHEGACLWFRGGQNIIRDNVCANARFAGYQFFQLLGGKVRVPTAPGNDPRVPAESTVLDVPTSAPIEFSGNESYAGNMSALELWQAGAAAQANVRWSRMTAWHQSGNGINTVYSPGFTLDGYRVRCDVAALADPKADPRGIGGHDAVSWTIANADIQGCRVGLDGRPSAHVLRDSTLRNELNLRPILGETTDAGGKVVMTPQSMFFQRVTSLALPGKPARHIEAVKGTSRIQKAVAPTTIRAEGWNGENFTIWFREQVDAYVIPGNLTTPRVPGELQQGMSNAENWTRYSVRLLNTLAPCQTPRVGFIGFVCP